MVEKRRVVGAAGAWRVKNPPRENIEAIVRSCGGGGLRIWRGLRIDSLRIALFYRVATQESGSIGSLQSLVVGRCELIVEISRRIVRMRFRGSRMPIAPREIPAYSSRLVDPINNGPAATLSGLSG